MSHTSTLQGLNTIMGSKIKQKLIHKYRCEGCGEMVQVLNTYMSSGPRKGQWTEGELGCVCDMLHIIHRNQQEAKQSRLKKIFAENSLINPALVKANIDNFNAYTPELKSALISCRNYVENFDIRNPSSLFFQGTFGTGKSHLSISISKAIRDKGYTSVFISIPKLLTKLRSTYNKGSEQSEDQILNLLADVDLVVFDDIGAESDATGWSMQKIFEVIDQRGGKHNIFTTNLSSKEFEKNKDMARIFSRLMMNSLLIIMNGFDYRKRGFTQ